MKQESINKIFGSKKFNLVIIAIFSIIFFGVYSSIFDQKPDLNGDNIWYYSLGKSISEGNGFTNSIGFKESPHTHFPPGYPTFIAAVMTFFSDSITTIKSANGILLFLSLLLMYFIVSRLTKNTWIALACTLICLFQADLLYYSTIMMSEMLYMFLSLAGISICIYVEEKETDSPYINILTKYIIPLALIVFYIYFVRTMALSFVLAVILFYAYRCIKEYRNKNHIALKHYAIICGLMIASIFIAKTSWDIRNDMVNKAKNDYISDFYKKLNGEKMSSFADWQERFVNNVSKYTAHYIPKAIVDPQLKEDYNATHIMYGILLLFVIFYGLFSIPGEIKYLILLFTLLTFGVLSVWPEQYSGARYFIANIPILIFLTINGIFHIILYLYKRIFKSDNILIVSMIAIAICSGVALKNYKQDFQYLQTMAKYTKWNANIVQAPLAEFIAMAEWCGKNLDDSARVICRKPELFYIFSGGIKSNSFPHYGKEEEIMKYLSEQKPTHIFVDRWYKHAYVTLVPVIINPKYSGYFEQIGAMTDPNSNGKEGHTILFKFHEKTQTPQIDTNTDTNSNTNTNTNTNSSNNSNNSNKTNTKN